VTVPAPDGGTQQVHRVQVLDPATGTGTFLHGVIDQIHATFKGNEGMWSGYVSEHLLPRLFGFELLMAPYAVAHLKLGLQLAETGYDFHSDERLRIYLTNTLEEAFDDPHGKAYFSQWLAEEAQAASKVKREAPVMVVLGNPPYSGHSANKGQWIANLLKGIDTLDPSHPKATASYFHVDGKPLKEKQVKWLHDDYVKFIRFAQWRIEQTGHGVLAFISNHGYLDNPTFRGMRQSLMQSFDEIFVLDLHGSTKKRESVPDDAKDENVFDIQQGVAIGIFIKHPKASTRAGKVQHAHLWGNREDKYDWLNQHNLANSTWAELTPSAPFYLFTELDETLAAEYQYGWKITEAMPVNSVGIVTARDALSIGWDSDELWNRVREFSALGIEEARVRFGLGKDARDWKVNSAQKDLKNSGPNRKYLTRILARPFDWRQTYYTGQTKGFHCMPMRSVMRHMLAGKNVALCCCRTVEIGRGFEHILVTDSVIQHHSISSKEVNYLFPLYAYAESEPGQMLIEGHHANLSPDFITDFSTRLKLSFLPDGKGDLKKSFGPEDIFAYAYAIFHAPSYRSRYAAFLKIDFPRLPLTSNLALFRKLCSLGEALVGLHLMEREGAALARFPKTGSNEVEKVRYEPGEEGGRVWINATQYFADVPEDVWAFHVGGYQVCEKWLKDRKGRVLNHEDLTHYRRVVAALGDTIRLMAEVDAAIEAAGGWPLP
jgi:predicted helicase